MKPNLNLYIEQLEKLSSKKVVLKEVEDIFIPRNMETRDEKYKQKIYKLLQQEVVEGNLDLSNLPFELKDLGNVKGIKGGLFLQNTKIASLGNLEYVSGNLNLQHTKITSLGVLWSVGGNLDLQNTKITSLPKGLKVVNGDLDLRNTPIISLPEGLIVGRFLYLSDTPIESLPEGLVVGRFLYLRNTPIEGNPELLTQYKKKYKI